MAVVAGAAIALVAAGCGGNSKPSTSSGSPATTSAASGATIAVATSKLGKVLVDDQGRTLYLFLLDKGTTSSCSGPCASSWPPVITNGAPKAGDGANAGDLGTTARADGKTQVTYHGHPLYRFAGDAKVGDTAGEGVNAFGAEWYVLGPNGEKIEPKGDKS